MQMVSADLCEDVACITASFASSCTIRSIVSKGNYSYSMWNPFGGACGISLPLFASTRAKCTMDHNSSQLTAVMPYEHSMINCKKIEKIIEVKA